MRSNRKAVLTERITNVNRPRYANSDFFLEALPNPFLLRWRKSKIPPPALIAITPNKNRPGYGITDFVLSATPNSFFLRNGEIEDSAPALIYRTTNKNCPGDGVTDFVLYAPPNPFLTKWGNRRWRPTSPPKEPATRIVQATQALISFSRPSHILSL